MAIAPNLNRINTRIGSLEKRRPEDPQLQILKKRQSDLQNPNPTVTTESVAPNLNRINTHIGYLQKIRPEDPQLKILRQKRDTALQNQQTPTTETPTTETPTRDMMLRISEMSPEVEEGDECV